MYNIPIYLWLLDTYHPILLSPLVQWLLKACGSKWEDLPSSLLERIQVMTVMFREGPLQCSPSYHFYILSTVPKNRTINELYARRAKGISILIWIPLSLIPVVLPAVLTHHFKNDHSGSVRIFKPNSESLHIRQLFYFNSSSWSYILSVKYTFYYE